MKKETKYVIVGVYTDTDEFLPLVETMTPTIYKSRSSAKAGAKRFAAALLSTLNRWDGRNVKFHEAWRLVNNEETNGEYGFDPVGEKATCQRIRIVEVK